MTRRLATIEALNEWIHDSSHRLLETLIEAVAVEHPDGIKFTRLMEAAARAGISAGLDLGIRAALLEPVRAEEFRAAFTDGTHDGDPNLATKEAMRFLDLADD